MPDNVQPHNQSAAHLWSAGGQAYDEISFQISDALSHAVQRLRPKPGERVLDVATGTGWTARNVARKGAQVTGVDIADELLAAAHALSAHLAPPIEFRHADAEKLPFPDASFDGVISTFGVMFAGDQMQAARELGRVCKPGGRLVLATWDPEGSISQFFGIVGKHSPAPPPSPSPLEWGKPDHVQDLLGDAFELRFETGVSTSYSESGAAVWDVFMKGFGPIKLLAHSLDEAARARLRDDFVAFHDRFMTENGLRWPREYLVTMGMRR